MPYDIFLAYAAEDYARVAPLVAQLGGMGWTVWWEQAILSATGDQLPPIEEAFNSAKAVVFAWSKHSARTHIRIDPGEEADCRWTHVRLDAVAIPTKTYGDLPPIDLLDTPLTIEQRSQIIASVQRQLECTIQTAPERPTNKSDLTTEDPRLQILVDPGTASPIEIAEFLATISRLYRLVLEQA